MKQAILNINYKENYLSKNLKGYAFPINEEFDRFVEVDINGKSIDFGQSEITIIDPDYVKIDCSCWSK